MITSEAVSELTPPYILLIYNAPVLAGTILHDSVDVVSRSVFTKLLSVLNETLVKCKTSSYDVAPALVIAFLSRFNVY